MTMNAVPISALDIGKQDGIAGVPFCPEAFFVDTPQRLEYAAAFLRECPLSWAALAYVEQTALRAGVILSTPAGTLNRVHSSLTYLWAHCKNEHAYAVADTFADYRRRLAA